VVKSTTDIHNLEHDETASAKKVLNVNESGNPFDENNLFPVANYPMSTYLFLIALGEIPNSETRNVYGESIIGEGSVNEQTLGDGMTGRYPFPSVAANMTLVSTSTDDDLGGTGLNVVLVRGNLGDFSELFEAVLMDGITPLNTINEYYRVNSLFAVSLGTNKSNVGTVTIKNGADLLAQMNPGKNLSRTAVYSIPLGKIGIYQKATFTTGKDDSGRVLGYFFDPSIPGVGFASGEVSIYQNQNFFSLENSPLALPEGNDLEMTGYSNTGTGDAEISVLVNLVLISS
jgi:hypothetical protein